MRLLTISLVTLVCGTGCFGQQPGYLAYTGYEYKTGSPPGRLDEQDYYCPQNHAYPTATFCYEFGDNHAATSPYGWYSITTSPIQITAHANGASYNGVAGLGNVDVRMVYTFRVLGPTTDSVPILMDVKENGALTTANNTFATALASVNLHGDTSPNPAQAGCTQYGCFPASYQGTLHTTVHADAPGNPVYSVSIEVLALTDISADASVDPVIYVDPTFPNASAYTVVVSPGIGNSPPPPPLQFVPVTPCRIIDTRGSTGTFGGPFLSGGGTRGIPVPASSCGIPSTAQAYSVNVTAAPRNGTLGYLTIWPTGQSRPNVSTLNSPDGSTLANAAIVPAGTSGSINAFATDDTDLIMDINGYYIPPGANTLQFYPLTPCRVLDTRNANGTFGGPSITGGTSRSFPIQSSSCSVPAAAQAYSFNVTAAPHGFLGYLTAFPTGQTRPNASTLNSLDGTVLANAAVVPAGTGGAVSFYANNTTDVVVDINGYYAAPATGGLNFYATAPCRFVDTRGAAAPLGGPSLTGNTSRTFSLSESSCGLSATPPAYSLNVTVAPSGFLGYLTAWPTGQAKPNASTLNAPKGLVLANAALVPSGTSGSVDVYALNGTHVVIDTNGYFGQ